MPNALQQQFASVSEEISQRVLGQQRVVSALLTAVLADGHVLLQGPPGVAKTRVALMLSHVFEGSFSRIQFTPDLLPSDLTGTNIYDLAEHRFEFHPGPLFHNFILADEINRAPAKVQAALLEAMAERQITAGGNTHRLDDAFFVIATQNPIDEEGTYELPVAQLDRFIMSIAIDYPSAGDEFEMLDLVLDERSRGSTYAPAFTGLSNISHENLRAARREVLAVQMADPVKSYIVRLVAATRGGREPGSAPFSELGLAHPVSPRGTLALAHLSRSFAWLDGRDFVTPEDVQAICRDALVHRVVLTHRALIDGLTPVQVIDDIAARVAVS